MIDMDGTVYSGDSAIEGVNEALRFLRENEVETFFLTNYAGRKRERYSEKLEKMGLNISREEIVTSGWLTGQYIQENFTGSEVFVLGEDGLKEELLEAGINLCEEPGSADVLVVSNKHDLDYDDLVEIVQGIDKDIEILGTNPDETIPGDDGLIPGAGTVISAVETMLGKEAKIIGKPSRNAVETVTGLKDVEAENCLMIGDRLNTDILMANENSMESVLVLTGVTDEKALKESDISPDHVLDSINNLPEDFRI